MDHSRERTIAEIYAACDEEYGAQFRREAEDLADDLVVNYDVDRPRTAVQGYALMRRAYAEVATRHRAEKKTVPTDTGPRGLSITDLPDSQEYAPGSLEKVTADIGKKMKTGTWKSNAFAEAGPGL